jgi:CheY-like chemotaxis protein
VPNEIEFFFSCEGALKYLAHTADKPFIVLSDINLPGMTGAEMKEIINQSPTLRRKSIPFVFLTTTSNHETVLASYEILSQGFFTKPDSINAMQNMVQMILNYWMLAEHPNPDLI